LLETFSRHCGFRRCDSGSFDFDMGKKLWHKFKCLKRLGFKKILDEENVTSFTLFYGLRSAVGEREKWSADGETAGTEP